MVIQENPLPVHLVIKENNLGSRLFPRNANLVVLMVHLEGNTPFPVTLHRVLLQLVLCFIVVPQGIGGIFFV